jgi:hypothetical protein
VYSLTSIFGYHSASTDKGVFADGMATGNYGIGTDGGENFA